MGAQLINQFLITDVTGSATVRIQRGLRARNFIVRVDKLKVCRSSTPSSWISTGVTVLVPYQLVKMPDTSLI